MGDKPDDVPSLEELADNDPLPEYWGESTTITVDRWVKESLDRHRDGRPWNQYLEQLRREHADPVTLNDVSDLADELRDDLSMASEPGVQLDVERLYSRLDELEAQLPDRTADEVEARFR